MSRSLESVIGEAAFGRVGQVQRAARTLDQLAEDALASGRMIGQARAGCWTGSAADRFRGAVDDTIYSNVEKLAAGCTAAADALRPYAAVLEDVQSEGRRLLKRLEALEQRARDAELLASARSSEAQTARSLAGFTADPAQQARLQQAASEATRAAGAAVASAGEARQAIVECEQQAQALRDRHERAARQANSGLSHASHMALRDGPYDALPNIATDFTQLGSRAMRWGQTPAGTVALYAGGAAVAAIAIAAAAPALGAAAGFGAAGLAVARVAQPLVGRAATVAKGAGAVSAAAGAGGALLGLADPTDTRSGDQRRSDVWNGLAGVALLPIGSSAGKTVGGVARDTPGLRGVNRVIERGVSTPGRRIYIHAPRRQLRDGLYGDVVTSGGEALVSAAVGGAPGGRSPDGVTVPGQTAATDGLSSLFVPTSPGEPSPLGPVRVSRHIVTAPVLSTTGGR